MALFSFKNGESGGRFLIDSFLPFINSAFSGIEIHSDPDHPAFIRRIGLFVTSILYLFQGFPGALVSFEFKDINRLIRLYNAVSPLPP